MIQCQSPALGYDIDKQSQNMVTEIKDVEVCVSLLNVMVLRADLEN